MCEFSHFNQNLLRLFDILNTFQYNILICLRYLTHFRFNVSWETHFKHQTNLKKKLFKGINLRISKYVELNWFTIFNRNKFQFSIKIEGPKDI